MSSERDPDEIVVGDFRTMMNASAVCVLVHDAATKDILWANPAACAMLEFSLDEIRPLKANDMSSSAQQYDRAIGRAWLQEAVDRGISRIEWHYRSKSGRVIATDALAIRIELAQGPAVMVHFRDIEREQRIERELRQTTFYVDALARHTSTVMFVINADGAIRFASDTAVAALGAGEPPVGLQLASYAALRSGPTPVRWTDLADSAAPSVPITLEIRRGDGQTVWLEGTVERLQQQESGGFLVLVHDVSDRVRGQEQREIELHRENYLARYTAMGDMAMAIAHELGQPLAAARNFLAGARSRLTAEADLGLAAYGIDAANMQIGRAASIVGAVRTFVAHLEQVEGIVDLNDIVDECLYFIRLRASPVEVEVRTDLAPEPVVVRCERVLTGQVVLNLCFNAVDEAAHAPAGRRDVVLATRLLEQEGAFLVTDQGRGVARDPFAEAFTSKEHGSGIGLALSHRIITRQHGRIWHEPHGAGSRFLFALPRAGGNSSPCGGNLYGD
jgi:PAS domain S-box-containing protein